jgi:F-type H+-transporting ATPase subunit gamma
MQTLEGLKRKIDSTEDLRSVVKTMKALAAVNIRQFENAVAALKLYNRTVKMALRVALRDRPGFSLSARPGGGGALGAVVFGSDQGMCGAINETVVARTLEAASALTAHGKMPLHLLAIGLRASNRLEDEGREVQKTFTVPSHVGGIMPLVQSLVLEIEQWLDRDDVTRVFLFHCAPERRASYRPRQVRLLPVDRQWLDDLRNRQWPGRGLPTFSMDWDALFAVLIRQYLFVSLFRASAESLAAENASRLAAMQGAESSIEDRLEALQAQYHRQRQMGITEELLDIVSGFEALTRG